MGRPMRAMGLMPSIPMGRGMGRHGLGMGNHGPSMGHPMAPPQPHHIEAMAAWMERHGPMRLIVQCHAGLGRAPSLAIVAAIMAGHGAHEAVMGIHGAVPEASPNRLILRHAEAITGEAIVTHVDRAWVSRRGRHGARGEAVGLRPVTWQGGDTPPVTGPPWEMQFPQAALGAALRLGQPKNGVPTLSEGASGGSSRDFPTPYPSVSVPRCTGLPGPRASGDPINETASDGSASAHSERAICISHPLNVGGGGRRDSSAHAPGAKLDRQGGDRRVEGGDHQP